MISFDLLTNFGFSFKRNSTHTSRTMMLKELQQVLSYLPAESNQSDYFYAISEENILGKRSVKTRMLTYHHLVNLYSLNNEVSLFSCFIIFLATRSGGSSLLALLCSFARDSVLRATTPFLLSMSEGETMNRQALENFINAQNQGDSVKEPLNPQHEI